MIARFRTFGLLNHIRRHSVLTPSCLYSEMIRDTPLEAIPNALSTSEPNPNIADQPRAADLLVRPKLRISDILAIKDGTLFTISQDASIDEAISHIVKQSVSCCLTLDGNGEVSGIFTARDILKFIHNTNNNNGSKHRGGQNSKMTANEMLSPPISEITVKKEKLVYCSPDDTVRQCREIMFQLRIRNLPVLSKNELLGIVSIQDLADSAFSLQDTGGKKGFIHNVTGRKGLPQGTKLNKDTKLHAAAGTIPGGISIKEQVKLALDVASYALPHPFKHEGGVGSSRRNYGASELQTDLAYCEDAHFTIRVPGTDPSQQQAYLCVADGVGSWRQFGVDPREFSHRLVENAQKVVEADAANREELMKTSSFFSAITADFQSDEDPIHPLDIIIDAWNQTCREKVTGSSTICVATLDNKLNQLSYSNLGDCGLVVMRHIDSETVGYMRESKPRHLRTHDLRVAYLSQQQLKSFNLPYQLGFSGIDQFTGVFETPSDADTASISVLPGDIILMATDGLFDNLDLDEILLLVNNWEDKWFHNKDLSLGLPHPSGDEPLKRLAIEIVDKARAMSLDKDRDSPFALLAKENDIMWGGGMPDDTSVVVARVIKEAN